MKKIITFCVLLVIFNPVYSSNSSNKHAMVVTDHYLASQVGLGILKQGGNAIDAAVAVGYALAVVDPCCGNIGGGGFMLIHFADGKNTFINFRETAPIASHPSLFKSRQQLQKGYLAVATPGTVLGLNTALAKYGTSPLSQLIAPAIRLAREGFILRQSDVDVLKSEIPNFQTQPNIAAIFLNHGKPYQVGDRLKQENLAHSLEEIAQKNNQAFYHGEIAQQIVRASELNAGILSLKDFNDYSVEERTPISCHYRGYKVITAPPPSAGGVTLCEMLNVSDAYPLPGLGFHSVVGTQLMLETMRLAFADRKFLGDPNYVKNPVHELLSKHYTEKLRQQITQHVKLEENKVHEGTHTTHYSIVDQQGNAVAVTYTLNSFFGAKVIAGKTGFFLNNEMDDFALDEKHPNQFYLKQNQANNIQPAKRPLSSMTPTILLRDKQLYMVIGAAGGATIITTVLETIQNHIDHGMPITQAINTPRYHFQSWPNKVYIEPNAFTPKKLEKLKQKGYQFTLGSPFSNSLQWGSATAIVFINKTNQLEGAVDLRRPSGMAVGF